MLRIRRAYMWRGYWRCQYAALDGIKAKEYVFVPWDGYRSRECKNRHRPADCNACLRPWFDAHRPAGVEPVVETFDEAEDNPAAAKPVKAVPKPNDKTVTRPRKMKDSAPVVTDDKVLPI